MPFFAYEPYKNGQQGVLAHNPQIADPWLRYSKPSMIEECIYCFRILWYNVSLRIYICLLISILCTIVYIDLFRSRGKMRMCKQLGPIPPLLLCSWVLLIQYIQGLQTRPDQSNDFWLWIQWSAGKEIVLLFYGNKYSKVTQKRGCYFV